MSMKDFLDYITTSPKDYNERFRRSAEQQRHVSKSDKVGPNFGKAANVDTTFRMEKKVSKPSGGKAAKRVVKEEVSSGNIGSVQPGDDSIGPNYNASPAQSMEDTSPASGGLSASNEGPAPGESAPDTTSRATWADPMDQARKSMGFKRGGSIKKVDGYTSAKDSIKKHSGGFKHSADSIKEHSAGFKPFHEHVQSMCGGGKIKK